MSSVDGSFAQPRWVSPTSELGPFPKPSPEKIFTELKLSRAPQTGPRVPREDWGGARRLIATDPEWAAWLEAERVAIDRWMARQRDRVEWVGGWHHDFTSPKDGSQLTWTAEVPGEEAPFFFSPSDPRVEITAKLFEAWVYGFRRRHAGRIVDAARLWRLTGETRYAEWTMAQLDFYAEHYMTWPLQTELGNPSRLFRQGLDSAATLIDYSEAARLLFDQAGERRRMQWLEKLLRPECDLLNASFQVIHNIACWHRSAVAHVALVYGDDALWRGALEGPHGLRAQLERGVTSDYLWFEQSLGYNDYVVSALLPFLHAIGRAGRGAEVAAEAAIVQNLMLAPIYLRFPVGTLPNPADAGGPRRAPNNRLLRAAYRVLPTWIGVREAAAWRSWNTLVDPPDYIGTPQPPLPEVTSRNLESSRFAVLRQGGWQLFFHYGQLNRSHSQNEALNFSAFYGDTPVSIDPGTVGYGSARHREYYKTGLNHNVPLWNGHGQQAWDRGELIAFDAANARVAAAQPRYRTGVSAQRELRIQGDKLIDVASISNGETRGPAPTPEHLGLALHLQGTISIPPHFSPALDFARDRPASFKYWSDVRAADYRDHASFLVACGSQTLRVTFHVPGQFRVYHGSSPDRPPQGREAFYLEALRTELTVRTELEPISENVLRR